MNAQALGGAKSWGTFQWGMETCAEPARSEVGSLRNA